MARKEPSMTKNKFSIARQVGMAKFKALHFALWQGLLYFCDLPHKNLLATQKLTHHAKIRLPRKNLLTAQNSLSTLARRLCLMTNTA